tara:strand:- start:409 stop:648 length:240 start_codon:yes stop_codon:yes gene_type:complete
MIKTIILEKIAQAIAKKFKLTKVLKYVEDPNDADERIDKLETTVFQQGRLIEFMLKGECCGKSKKSKAKSKKEKSSKKG